MFKKTDNYGGHLQGYVELVPAQLKALFGDPNGFCDDQYMDWYQLEDDDGHFATIYSKWTHPSENTDRLFSFNVGGNSYEDMQALVEYLENEGLNVGVVDAVGNNLAQWEATQRAHMAVEEALRGDAR